jgi:hypothetical protein
MVLKGAAPFTAAWHAAQELAPNDYVRIDWKSIAADLLAE